MERSGGLPGICLVVLTGIAGCGGSDTSGSSSPPPPPAAVELPPTQPIISPAGDQTDPGVVIAFTASSTDPQHELLEYNWDFGDGASGNGALVNHSFSIAGDYTVKVTAVNQHSVSASATAMVHVNAYPPLAAPRLYNSNPHHLLGQVFTSDWTDDDPNGITGSASWDFGDGTTATFVAQIGGTRHVYPAPGHYTATLTVGIGSGRKAATSVDIEVEAGAPTPQLTENRLEPYCNGAYCSAVDSNTYAGHGVGIWRYHNATSAPASLDIFIAGVSAGQLATLVFSNGQRITAPSLPDPGTSPTAQAPALIAKLAQPPGAAAIAAAHLGILQRNITFAKAELARRAPAHSIAQSQKLTVRPHVRADAPAVGTAAQWIDDFAGPVTYNMQVGATCALVDGRNAVVWIDSDQVSKGQVSADDAVFLAQRFCGASGIYARETAMLGAPWGVAADTDSNLIHDPADQLLDINIVIPGVPDGTAYSGYYSSANTAVRTFNPQSNAALAVFLNGHEAAFYHGANGPRQTSTLVHELTHMINDYQRAVVRGTVHAVFLEETSAMMTQDYLASSLLDYPGAYDYTTMDYVSNYATNGAGESYIGWTAPSGFLPTSYFQGYAFGAHLHRRYGLDMDRRILNCNDQGDEQSSYQCVEAAIQQLGGVGFEDDFARMGAATLGMLPLDSVPGGFGYPPLNLEGYTLPYVDVASLQYLGIKTQPKALANGFLPTTHAFEREAIAETVYHRAAVTVPARTTLMLIIVDQRPGPTPAQ
jgi:hypothetical protein